MMKNRGFKRNPNPAIIGFALLLVCVLLFAFTAVISAPLLIPAIVLIVANVGSADVLIFNDDYLVYKHSNIASKQMILYSDINTIEFSPNGKKVSLRVNPNNKKLTISKSVFDSGQWNDIVDAFKKLNKEAA